MKATGKINSRKTNRIHQKRKTMDLMDRNCSQLLQLDQKRPKALSID